MGEDLNTVKAVSCGERDCILVPIAPYLTRRPRWDGKAADVCFRS